MNRLTLSSLSHQSSLANPTKDTETSLGTIMVDVVSVIDEKIARDDKQWLLGEI